MKKALYMISIFVLLLFVAACSNAPDISGMWFSDMPDTVSFGKDGTYTGDGWLSTGKYEVIDGRVELVGFLDGGKTLLIQKEGSKTVLVTANGSHTYYRDKGVAEEKIRQREEAAAEAARKAEEEAAEKLKKIIVGFWVSDGFSPISFTDTGEYIYYDLDSIELQIGSYEVIDSGTVCINNHGDDVAGTVKISFENENNMTFRSSKYTKIELLEASTELLVGHWESGPYSKVIFTEEQFVVKSNFEILPDRVWGYELKGDNTYLRFNTEQTLEEKMFIYEEEGSLKLLTSTHSPIPIAGGYTVSWGIFTKTD